VLLHRLTTLVGALSGPVHVLSPEKSRFAATVWLLQRPMVQLFDAHVLQDGPQHVGLDMMSTHTPFLQPRVGPQQVEAAPQVPPSATQLAAVLGLGLGLGLGDGLGDGGGIVAATQLPPMQAWFVLQLRKQLPQLRGSVSKSTHTAGRRRHRQVQQVMRNSRQELL
jgi:hypothetical protein